MADTIWTVDSKWYFYDSATGNQYMFDTRLEAINAMAKLDTARSIVVAVQALATPTDLSADLVAQYFDAGTFTDEDVASLGITAAQLTSCITLLQQVEALMTDQATTPAMYRSTLNAVRYAK